MLKKQHYYSVTHADQRCAHTKFRNPRARIREKTTADPHSCEGLRRVLIFIFIVPGYINVTVPSDPVLNARPYILMWCAANLIFYLSPSAENLPSPVTRAHARNNTGEGDDSPGGCVESIYTQRPTGFPTLSRHSLRWESRFRPTNWLWSSSHSEKRKFAEQSR